VPNEVDTKFLKQFRALIIGQIKKGHRFILITGGGKTCRNYQAALKLVASPKPLDLDWLGIYSTRFNAQLVRLMFGKLAHQKVVENPNEKVKFQEKILVAGGWIPGRSTDDDAVRLAKTYNSKTIVNLSNIDYVYDKDPKKFKNAKKFEQMSWTDYLRLAGKKWQPGANYPFDPVAAKFAKQHQQKVIIVNGKNLKNLEKILSSKPFIGTTIS